MLDIKRIIENFDEVTKKLTSRGVSHSVMDELKILINLRSELMIKTQELKSKINNISKKVGENKSKGIDCKNLFDDVSKYKDLLNEVSEEEKTTNLKVREMLLYIPNVPNNNTPIGKDESNNEVIYKKEDLGRGKVEGVIPHYEIGKKLDILDFEKTVNLSASRFWSYKNDGAKLLRALQSFMLDEHTNNGYKEIIPPLLVNEETLVGTGNLPKFAEDLFHIREKNLYLIPTAEVPLTNFYANSVLDLSTPLKLTAFTPCFRSEAGSGGKDMKGLIRAHQFYKVEIVKIVDQKDSASEYKKSFEDCANILEKLELPYQALRLCSGDIGFSAAETIDLEVWIPSEKRYRETSSISNFGDYQSRRAMLRYKDEDGKNKYAHTINGSGLAIDRIIASILEIYQNNDGTIDVPKVLVKYMGKQKIM